MTSTPPTNEALVAAISAQLPAVSDEQVTMVLEVLHTVQHGEPLGTIVTDPDTGAVAVRVAENGIHQWRVTYADGGTSIDRQPTLPGWQYLRQVEQP